eukprot:GEMP01024850.1.p1 GENE.GEMP01024850.1~~GEMP01024850.1.p1  ORF type:complete len:349 (+),score=62.34 GEMP01024850.1:854-1900(+)
MIVDKLARQTIFPVTIRTLLEFESLGPLATAQFLQRELSVRLAHRVKDIHYLPYVCILRAPSIREVCDLYQRSLDDLQNLKINTPKEEEEFYEHLRAMVAAHKEVLPLMQRGYAELDTVCGDDPRLNKDDLSAFLDRFMTTRIGNRVLAEHYFGLGRSKGEDPNRIGVVKTNCFVKDIVADTTKPLVKLIHKMYGVKSDVIIRGQLNTEFSFIPEHISFIMNELLKNALRATVEKHKNGGVAIPPVVVDIRKGEFDVTLKISDLGNGIVPSARKNVWKYGYTTAPVDGNFDLCGYGFGLPLSRLYAQFFGGDIHIQTLYGHGTDCYVNLNHLGTSTSGSSASSIEEVL